VKKEAKKIVFYDGDCGFCNKSVQFILRHEKDKSLHFAPLQSSFAERYFTDNQVPQPDMSTFYFADGSNFLEKSDAALSVASHLKFPYSTLRFFWVIPQYLRDKIYDLVAKRRQKISSGFCVLPDKVDRKRFLA
jgi:predicted DCC family thiol-disulfide oxidoreductase YuxK